MRFFFFLFSLSADIVMVSLEGSAAFQAAEWFSLDYYSLLFLVFFFFFFSF